MNLTELFTSGLPKLIIFGHSYSSTTETLKHIPPYVIEVNYPSSVYKQQRFADGLVWTDHLESKLSVGNVFNLACGGAFHVLESSVPSVKTQIEMHQEPFNKKDLYIVWAGFNDMSTLGGIEAARDAMVNVETLISKGARQIIIPGYYSFSRLPGQAEDLDGQQKSLAFNAAMQTDLARLEREHPGLQLLWLDTNTFFENLLQNAARKGFLHVDEACFEGASPDDCDDPHSYIFIDRIHWTSHTHRLFAEFAAEAIRGRFHVKQTCASCWWAGLDFLGRAKNLKM